jgi:hypothetical protein
VICSGCSDDPWTRRERANGETTFEFAAIERKYPASEMTPDDKTGWAWPELELVDEEAGGAPRAHRDALKLLAVLLQHTDSKPEQQRLVCGDGEEPASDGACRRPFMMINDLGLTFGRANNLNRNERGSTNFKAWTEVGVWKDPARCVGYLEKSFTGTLEHPVISEAGRKFLADLIGQLTDAQLRALFDVSRVARRAVEVDGVEQRASADEWVAAFKHKRAQIVNHRCG